MDGRSVEPGSVYVYGILHGEGTHYDGHYVGSGHSPDWWVRGGNRLVAAYLRGLFRGAGILVGGREVGHRHPPGNREKESPYVWTESADAASGGDDDWPNPHPDQ